MASFRRCVIYSLTPSSSIRCSWPPFFARRASWRVGLLGETSCPRYEGDAKNYVINRRYVPVQEMLLFVARLVAWPCLFFVIPLNTWFRLLPSHLIFFLHPPLFRTLDLLYNIKSMVTSQAPPPRNRNGACLRIYRGRVWNSLPPSTLVD